MERYMIYIPAKGICRLIPCDGTGTLTLNEMQALVDGPIEVTESCLEPRRSSSLRIRRRWTSVQRIASAARLVRDDKEVNRMKNFFEDVGEFLADNWVTIVLSAATTIVIRLLLSL